MLNLRREIEHLGNKSFDLIERYVTKSGKFGARARFLPQTKVPINGNGKSFKTVEEREEAIRQTVDILEGKNGWYRIDE